MARRTVNGHHGKGPVGVARVVVANVDITRSARSSPVIVGHYRIASSYVAHLKRDVAAARGKLATKVVTTATGLLRQ